MVAVTAVGGRSVVIATREAALCLGSTYEKSNYPQSCEPYSRKKGLCGRGSLTKLPT